MSVTPSADTFDNLKIIGDTTPTRPVNVPERSKSFADAMDRAKLCTNPPDSATVNTPHRPHMNDLLPKLNAMLPDVQPENSIRRSVSKTVYAQVQTADTTVKNKSQACRRYDELASKFESGKKGIGAIGYDRKGGTSYGKYQISSRAGTMDSFIKFLDDKHPEWAQRLKNAGPTDTGSCEGTMPDEWRSIASEDPKRFEGLQHDFIAKTHFQPAVRLIDKRAGVNLADSSPAVREVLWSTAVQHGPGKAAKIFTQALNGLDPAAPDFERSLIANVYEERRQQFLASSPSIKSAMRSRFEKEEHTAVALHHNQPKEPISII